MKSKPLNAVIGVAGRIMANKILKTYSVRLCVDWVYLAGCSEHGNELPGSSQTTEFLDYRSSL
jgi:hypothetical protein